MAAVPLTGGCLCGAVRYIVTFKDGDPFPPRPHTCQCTPCRKFTGSVIAFYLLNTLDQVDIQGKENVSEYHSSPSRCWASCKICHSSLYWRDKSATPNEIELYAGTLDKALLVPPQDDEAGLARARSLVLPTDGQFQLESGIPGVTKSVGDPFGGVAAADRWMENAAVGTREGA